MTTHSGPARVAGPDRSIAILLIDDQPFVGMAVGRLLVSESDMTLHCCHTAAAAVAHANQVAPSVILQDLNMPEIDGLTLVRRFRANPATAVTPIIVLSGSDDAEARAGAAAAGASDYLVKLPRRDALIACIRRNVAALLVLHTPAVAVVSPRAVPTFDRSFIAEVSAGVEDPRALVAELIDQFLGDAAAGMALINQAAGSWDAPVLRAQAHSLKGASGAIGASRLAALCAQLEERLDRQPGELVKALLIKALNEELGRVRTACLQERDGRLEGQRPGNFEMAVRLGATRDDEGEAQT